MYSRCSPEYLARFLEVIPFQLSLSFSRISRSKENRRRAKERKESLWKEYLLIENNRDYLRFITVAGEQRLDAWSIFHGMTRPRMDSYLFDNRHKLFPSLLLVWIIHDANVPLLVGGKSGETGRIGGRWKLGIISRFYIAGNEGSLRAVLSSFTSSKRLNIEFRPNNTRWGCTRVVFNRVKPLGEIFVVHAPREKLYVVPRPPAMCATNSYSSFFSSKEKNIGLKFFHRRERAY